MDENNTKSMLMAWVGKDFIVIIVCILCLGACAYTLYTTGQYQQQINKAWTEQWEKSGCKMNPYQPNITFNYRGVYNEDTD